MKLLLFTDIHGDMRALNIISKKARNADMLICAGDISSMGNELPKLMTKLNMLKKPLLLTPGNHEDEQEHKELCSTKEHITFFHKAVHIKGNYCFLGYGGGGFSKDDRDFEKIARIFFSRHIKDKEVVLVTHGPPYQTNIDLIGKEHRGNVSYRRFIDHVQPRLVVCGHLHEHFGKSQQIGRTLIINPGKKGIMVQL